jgi:uncharacterized protein (DUF1810 family)
VSATDRADDLERFIVAQGPVFATVLTELRAVAKRTHWMWFIFPQLRGLGRSSMAAFYGLASIEKARASHAHPLLRWASRAQHTRDRRRQRALAPRHLRLA